MSGHSKWATIKRKKGAIDAKRGKIFTKLVREIMTAARLGGGDPSGNPRLRMAILDAKAERMPNDTIDRAIKKATGQVDGASFDDVTYEGYGPAGVAILVEAQTDNRNRTIAEIRTAFTKNGGNMGTDGSVAWLFKKTAVFTFDAKRFAEDDVLPVALEGSARDVRKEGDFVIVTAEPRDYADLFERFEASPLQFEAAELTMIPDTQVKVTGEDAERVVRLIEKLEDLDDVQKVYANFDIDEAELERLAQ